MKFKRSSTSIPELIDGLLANLFLAEQRNNQRWVDQLVEENDALLEWPIPARGFQFRGNIYHHSQEKGARRYGSNFKFGIPVIHTGLHERIEQLLTEVGTQELDKQRIKQFLSVLYSGVESMQEVRDRTPDILAPMLPVKEHLPRMFPFEMAVKLTNAQMEEYNRLLPAIQLYSASRLLL